MIGYVIVTRYYLIIYNTANQKKSTNLNRNFRDANDFQGYNELPVCLFVRQHFQFESSNCWGWRLWLWRTLPDRWLMASNLVTSWSSKTTLISLDWWVWTRWVDPTMTSNSDIHLVMFYVSCCLLWRLWFSSVVMATTYWCFFLLFKLFIVLFIVVYRFGPRFPAMSGCYDKGLRCLAMEIAKQQGIAGLMQEGVYAMVGGPNFETIAEARLLHRLGVDAVGMTHTQKSG